MSVARASVLPRRIHVALGGLAILSLLVASIAPAQAGPGNGKANGRPDRQPPAIEEPVEEQPPVDEPDVDEPVEGVGLPTVLEQVGFGASYTGVVHSGSWSPLGEEELLAVVALRPAGTVVSEVTGNGLEWSRVRRHRDLQGELAVEVWRASGPAPTAGPLTVATSSDAWSLNVQGLRLTPSSVVADAGADTGASDTRHPAVEVSAPAGTALLMGVHVGRATPFTPDAGLEVVSAHAVGDAGNNVRATVLSRPSAEAGVYGLGGTQSSALDWVMAGLVLHPR